MFANLISDKKLIYKTPTIQQQQKIKADYKIGKGLEQTFSKKDTSSQQKHMKRYSDSQHH